jgi:hypothetical protein
MSWSQLLPNTLSRFERNTELNGRRAYYLAVALAAIVAEGALIYFAFAGKDPRVILAVHAAVCVVPASLAAAHRHDLRLKSTFLILAVWTFIAGPLGALIAAAVAFASSGESIIEFGEWFDRQASGDADRVRDLKSALACRRVRIDGASEAKPLRDAISDGALKEKYDALNIIQRRFDPSFVPALRLAAVDPDQSVRVLAATVAIKLHTRLSTEIQSLKNAAESKRSVEALLALAEAHGRFAASGLLSPTETQEQLDRAAARHLDALEFARAMNPARLQLIQQIVRAIEEKWPEAASAERLKTIEQYQADKEAGADAPSEPARASHGMREPEESPPKRKSQ